MISSGSAGILFTAAQQRREGLCEREAEQLVDDAVVERSGCAARCKTRLRRAHGSHRPQCSYAVACPQLACHFKARLIDRALALCGQRVRGQQMRLHVGKDVQPFKVDGGLVPARNGVIAP